MSGLSPTPTISQSRARYLATITGAVTVASGSSLPGAVEGADGLEL